jgi:hypothetical protein
MVAPANNNPHARFHPGRIYATPAAQRAIAASGQSPVEFLERHLRGDWGDVSPDDRRANDDSLQDGARILSAYHTSLGTKLWVLTEAVDDDGQRAATTLLLPDDY